MSANRIFTHAAKMAYPFQRVGMHGVIPVHFRLRLPRFLSWLARREQERSHPVAGAEDRLTNECFSEDGDVYPSGDSRDVQRKDLQRLIETR